METKTTASARTSILPIGTIVAFALTSTEIPQGWLLCDGSTIPLKYQTLIICLKSPNTPNFCGRTLIGTGTPSNGVQSDGTTPNFDPSNNWPLAYTGGEFRHTLLINEIPAHTHTSPTNQGGWSRTNGDSVYGSDRPQEQGNYPFTTGSTGGSGAHNNMQPYCAVNYIIYAGTH